MGGTGGAGEPNRGDPRIARLGEAVEARGGGTIEGGVSSPPYGSVETIPSAKRILANETKGSRAHLSRVIDPSFQFLIVIEGLLVTEIGFDRSGSNLSCWTGFTLEPPS